MLSWFLAWSVISTVSVVNWNFDIHIETTLLTSTNYTAVYKLQKYDLQKYKNALTKTNFQ